LVVIAQIAISRIAIDRSARPVAALDSLPMPEPARDRLTARLARMVAMTRKIRLLSAVA
jgi:hypothetical protein